MSLGTSRAVDRPRGFKGSRAAAVVVGVGFTMIAVLADVLGLGRAGSVGVGQVLLGLVGVLLVLLGILGRRFGAFYSGLALVSLNVVVLLGLLELGAIVVSRVALRAETGRIETLPYYASKEWSDTYWREARTAVDYAYEPYVVWRHRPFAGELVNVDEHGSRRTPNADCVEQAWRVFAFGGSTMRGWGAPDWETIPAYLQEGLRQDSERPVCVVNLAVDGYVSTQSVVALMLQLQAGHVPDVVVFYDGVNEVLAAFESGRPRVHVTLEDVASRFEERAHPLLMWFRSSRLASLLDRWLRGALRSHHARTGTAGSQLAEEVTRQYLENLRIVELFASHYGFDVYFFLQPHLGIGEKPLTEGESAMLSRTGRSRLELARETYRRVKMADSADDNLWDLSGVFDGNPDQIWIDEAGHFTPLGNRLVAREILNVLER